MGGSGAATTEPVKITLPESTLFPLAGWNKDNQIFIYLYSMPKVAVYTLPSVGGMATRITPAGAEFGAELVDPERSRDGKRVLTRYGTAKLAHVPSDGGQPADIPIQANPSIFVVAPVGGNQISPDSQRIAVAAAYRTERVAHNWTLPAGGGDASQLSSGPLQDRHPAWSPDGKTIASVRRTAGDGPTAVFNLCAVPSAGGEVRQLTRDSDDVTYYSGVGWSPGGRCTSAPTGRATRSSYRAENQPRS